jgi:hypothetical protein
MGEGFNLFVPLRISLTSRRLLEYQLANPKSHRFAPMADIAFALSLIPL